MDSFVEFGFENNIDQEVAVIIQARLKVTLDLLSSFLWQMGL